MIHQSPGQPSYGDKEWGSSSSPTGVGSKPHCGTSGIWGQQSGQSASVLTQPPG